MIFSIDTFTFGPETAFQSILIFLHLLKDNEVSIDLDITLRTDLCTFLIEVTKDGSSASSDSNGKDSRNVRPLMSSLDDKMFEGPGIGSKKGVSDEFIASSSKGLGALVV